MRQEALMCLFSVYVTYWTISYCTRLGSKYFFSLSSPAIVRSVFLPCLPTHHVHVNYQLLPCYRLYTSRYTIMNAPTIHKFPYTLKKKLSVTTHNWKCYNGRTMKAERRKIQNVKERNENFTYISAFSVRPERLSYGVHSPSEVFFPFID